LLVSGGVVLCVQSKHRKTSIQHSIVVMLYECETN